MAGKYRVTHDAWLTTEVQRMKDILVGVKYWGIEWTLPSLKDEMHDIGLAYTPQQLQEIGTRLIADGIIEEVV